MSSLAARAIVGCVVVGAAAIGYAAAPSSATSLRANDVLADVSAQGARTVVTALWADGDQWNHVMANIGRGTPEWLRVAVALHSGTDAGASESLEEAVFIALKAAPAAILELLKEGQFATSAVCSSNVGIDLSPAESRRLIRDRIKILSGLPDSAVHATRDQCLAGLRAALADLGH